MNIQLSERLSDVAGLIEKRAAELLVCYDPDVKTVYDAMTYSFMAGGKRIRPFLVLEFTRLFGGNEQDAADLATALEMVHTYSLIHDDLPCMDNDDYRRGKLTNHKVFGEAAAVLAGDALLTRAFSVISDCRLPDRLKITAVSTLSHEAGAEGMIGGQIIDMESENGHPSADTLVKLQNKKTGALFRAAVKLGCIAAGADDKQTENALLYADKIGLAFQITDDILDKYGDSSVLGKNIGSDEANGKTTFLSYMTKEEAKKTAEKLTEEAISAVSGYTGSETLVALAEYLLTRKK